MSSLDLVTALWMMKKLKSTNILNSPPPLTFVSGGKRLLDYMIYGNSGGVGDRINLFDNSNADITTAFPDPSSGKLKTEPSYGDYPKSVIIAVEPNTTYTIQIKKLSTVFVRTAEYTSYPQVGDAGTMVTTNATLENDASLGASFTTSATAANIVWYFSWNATESELQAKLDSMMLSKGTELKDYQPYNKFLIAELETLRQSARKFGSETVFSASESAQALKFMALAGWDADKSIAALPGVLNLAAASGMSLGTAADMVTDYLSAFNMKAEQSKYLADLGAVVIDRLREIEQRINNDPELMFLDNVRNTRKEYAANFFRICNELGLSPQSRAKLGSLAVKKDSQDSDPILRLFGGEET